ncbi:MAG: hypothetical protein ACHQFW_12130 [Chitinophagales bacterium]
MLYGLVIFISIMLATVLIAAFPGITIRLMEVFKFYKKGELFNEKRNYLDGSGALVYRRVYLLFNNGKEKFANMQVFLRLLMISTILSSLLFSIYYFSFGR